MNAVTVPATVSELTNAELDAAIAYAERIRSVVVARRAVAVREAELDAAKAELSQARLDADTANEEFERIVAREVFA